MAPPDAQASASFVCSAFLSYCLRWHPGSDRLGTIDLPCRRASGVVIQCRAIVPNGSARRVSVGVFRLFGFFCLTGRGGILVPIDWGQSIYHADAQAAVSYSVEPLSPMAPPDAQAAASYVCSAFLSYWSRWLPGSDRLGTIDLPYRLLADAESAEQGIEDVVVGHRTGDLA